MSTTRKLGLPLLDSGIDVSVDHLKINEVSTALDTIVSTNIDAITENSEQIEALTKVAVRTDAANVFSENQHVTRKGGPAQVVVTSTHGNSGLMRAGVVLQGARGTQEAMLPLQNNDFLGQYTFAATDEGGQSVETAYLRAVATQNHRNGTFGTQLEVATTANKTTGPQVRGRVWQDGTLEWLQPVIVGGVNVADTLADKASQDALESGLDTKADKTEALSRIDEIRLNPDTSKPEYNENYGTGASASWKQVGGVIQPIGAIMHYQGTQPPAGCVALGSGRTILQRTQYPELWAWVRDHGDLRSEGFVAGQEGFFFGDGDGSTTFSLPQADGIFFAATGTGRRGRGNVQGDAIRNITGDFSMTGIEQLTASGAFYKTSRTTGPNGHSTYSTDSGVTNFDASLVVPTASENRPKNVALNICIVAASGVDDPALINAAATVSQVSQNTAAIAAVSPKVFRQPDAIYTHTTSTSTGGMYSTGLAETTFNTTVRDKNNVLSRSGNKFTANKDCWVEVQRLACMTNTFQMYVGTGSSNPDMQALSNIVTVYSSANRQMSFPVLCSGLIPEGTTFRVYGQTARADTKNAGTAENFNVASSPEWARLLAWEV